MTLAPVCSVYHRNSLLPDTNGAHRKRTVGPAQEGSALVSADAHVEPDMEQDSTWHCTRHHFTSKLAMAGVDTRTMGTLLTNKSLARG